MGHDGLESSADLGSSSLYRHDAFGNYLDRTQPRTWDMDPALRMPDRSYLPESGAGSLGFAGGAVDPASGLVYAKARWYHPGVGRFLSEDPLPGRLEDPMSLHPFLYANGNPVTNVDPDGAASVSTDACRVAVNPNFSLAARVGSAFGFLSWRALDTASFGTLEGVARIVDAEELGNPRYGGEEGRAQAYRDMWAIAAPGLAKTAVAAVGGRIFLGAGGGSVGLGRRVVTMAAEGATLGGAVNTVGQLTEMAVGTRDDFSVEEAASEALAWGAVGVGLGLGAEAVGAAGSAIERGASAAWARAWPRLRPRLNPMNYEFDALYAGLPVPKYKPRIGRSRFTVEQFKTEFYRRYQAAVDEGYAEALVLEGQGRLRITTSPEAARGTHMDRFARREMRQWLKSESIAEGPGEFTQVNRYLRNPRGGGYRIPDARGGGQIYDASLEFKTAHSPQVREFRAFSSGDQVTIVRPTAVGGSYSILF